MGTSRILSLMACLRHLVCPAIITACVWKARAQGYLSVSSTTDGSGLFSYTFNLGSSGYVWGVLTNSDGVSIQVYGVENVISPSGWSATIGANDWITWRPTDGTAYLGQPSVTFSVQSIYSGVVNYDQTAPLSRYLKGTVLGAVYTASDHQFEGGGYENFSFLGPEPVPEPRTLTLLSLAGSMFIVFVKRSLLRKMFSWFGFTFEVRQKG